MMLMNLFSVFDPTTSMLFAMNWICVIYLLLFMPFLYWFIPSRFIMLLYIIVMFLLNEFSVLMNKKNNQMNLLIYISLFFFILLSNLMGMFSYIFTSSSHLVVSLTLYLSLCHVP